MLVATDLLSRGVYIARGVASCHAVMGRLIQEAAGSARGETDMMVVAEWPRGTRHVLGCTLTQEIRADGSRNYYLKASAVCWCFICVYHHMRVTSIYVIYVIYVMRVTSVYVI